MTQICKAKSPYSNSKIKFSKILATSYPRVFISKDSSATWEFSCSSVWPATHKEKYSTFFPSALTEPMDFHGQPSVFGEILFLDQDLTYSFRVYKTSLRSHSGTVLVFPSSFSFCKGKPGPLELGEAPSSFQAAQGLPGTNILLDYHWFWLVKTPRPEGTMPRKQQHTQDIFSELLFTVKF